MPTADCGAILRPRLNERFMESFMLTNNRPLFVAAGLGILALSSVLLASSAQAQPYTGSAYILQGKIGTGVSPILNVAAGAEINKVSLPFPNGGAGNSANSNSAGVTLGVGNAVSLGAINTATAELASAVTSTASVNNTNVLPNFYQTQLQAGVDVNTTLTNLTRALSGSANVSAHVSFSPFTGSLLQADLIGAQAQDTPFIAANGSSNFVNLSALGNIVTANGSISQTIPLFVTVNISTTANFLNGLTATTLTGTTQAQIGELVLNEQLPQPSNPALITVNAVHLKLYPNVDLPNLTLTGQASILGIGLTSVSADVDLPSTNLVGVTAGTDLIVSSATAGSLGAAAPEPGTFALLGMGSVFGMVLLRRRATAKA